MATFSLSIIYKISTSSMATTDRDPLSLPCCLRHGSYRLKVAPTHAS